MVLKQQTEGFYGFIRVHNAFSSDVTIPLTLSWSDEVIIWTKMLKGWMFLIKSIEAQVVLYFAQVRLDEEAHKLSPP